ncbi:hypothetical protein [Hydrocarboniclastica marina]|uniref:Uncharacterized protein n=1 Tax=Hydrocarboniclastica marina TaxID=2259620 RepID=A0A4P7XCM4_9ALTE|nr:hypothetical protein [Hydrocarboniclastica marina]QCF24599.1 hypothetical protein soil367_00745 [Hydrocarboniclastica marina]
MQDKTRRGEYKGFGCMLQGHGGGEGGHGAKAVAVYLLYEAGNDRPGRANEEAQEGFDLAGQGDPAFTQGASGQWRAPAGIEDERGAGQIPDRWRHATRTTLPSQAPNSVAGNMIPITRQPM